MIWFACFMSLLVTLGFAWMLRLTLRRDPRITTNLRYRQTARILSEPGVWMLNVVVSGLAGLGSGGLFIALLWSLVTGRHTP